MSSFASPDYQLPPENPANVEYTELLLECMQMRLDLARDLRSLADSQAQAASQDSVDATLGLLSRKQSLLAELAEVQQRLRPYFGDDPEGRVWKNPDRRELCRKLADEGGEMLRQAMLLEKNTLDEMTSRRDAVAAQLQDGQNSILAHSAYMAEGLLNDGALDISDL